MKPVARSSAHAVQVSFFVDPQARDGESLLQEWHTLPGVAAGAARAGAFVTIVQAAARREILERDGVVFHFIDDSRSFQLRLPWGVGMLRPSPPLVELVKSLRPDVIHLHGFVDPVAIWRFAHAVRDVPVLLQDHATRLPHGLHRKLWSKVCRSVDAVAFTTRAQAQPFFEAGVFPREMRLFEILEGSSFFTPGDRSAARHRTGIHGDPCLLWTGNLDSNKDPLTALDAFERAAPRLRDPRMWCVFRQAPLFDAVRRRIAASPTLSARVTLLGKRPYNEMEDLFRAADFFVQTSHFEGSGFSALEALACGTPALLTDIPSFRRIVNQGEAGSLTPVGDGLALGEAMVRLAGTGAPDMRRVAKEWFERGLSFDAIGRDLCAAYESLARSAQQG